MNSQILVKEFIRLLKENKKTIVKMTGIIWLLIMGTFIFYSFYNNNENQNDSIQTREAITNPGIFRLYVELEDGTVFTNSMIIEEYFLLPDVISAVEESTGVEVTDILDEQVKRNLIKTQYDRGALGVSRNGSTNILTFIVNVGDEEENLALANYYFDFILAGNVNVLDNKIIHVVSEPEIYDESSYAASDIAVEASSTNQSSVNIILEIIIVSIAGFIFGFAAALLYLVIKNLLGPTLNYSFTYSVDDLDKVQLINRENDDILTRAVLNAENEPIVILSESNLPESLRNAMKNSEYNKKIIVTDSIGNIDPSVKIINPIVLIYSKQTNKTWYSQTSKELNILQASKIVIQIV